MIPWFSIVSSEFAVFELIALHVMTRGGRGWLARGFGFSSLIVTSIILDRFSRSGCVSHDHWLLVCFASKIGVITLAVFMLSRDSVGRRLFLSITYSAYSLSFAVVSYLLFFRNVFALPIVWAGVVCLLSLTVMNLAMFAWVFPSLPRDNMCRYWHIPCFYAGMVSSLLFFSGIWPTSIVTTPLRHCLPFLFGAVIAWCAVPIFYRLLRAYNATVVAKFNLELLTSELKVNRAALEQARRIRHDQRHHLKQIAEYAVSSQPEKLLAYIKELEGNEIETSAQLCIWCENETINAILSGFVRKAAAKGICFAANACVDTNICLSDTELVTVFANLIENAINATERAMPVPGAANAVRVGISQKRIGICITVTNPVPKGFALTSKGLPCAEPGVGLESAWRVIEKHDGALTYTLSDGILTCQAVLIFDDAGKAS